MKYFSKITADHWTLHNNAHKEARKLAYSMDKILISERAIPAFKRKFTHGIDEINQQNPKCKPLDLEIWNHPLQIGISRDIFISIPGNFHMSLYKVKSEDKF